MTFEVRRKATDDSKLLLRDRRFEYKLPDDLLPCRRLDIDSRVSTK